MRIHDDFKVIVIYLDVIFLAGILQFLIDIWMVAIAGFSFNLFFYEGYSIAAVFLDVVDYFIGTFEEFFCGQFAFVRL